MPEVQIITDKQAAKKMGKKARTLLLRYVLAAVVNTLHCAEDEILVTFLTAEKGTPPEILIVCEIVLRKRQVFTKSNELCQVLTSAVTNAARKHGRVAKLMADRKVMIVIKPVRDLEAAEPVF